MIIQESVAAVTNGVKAGVTTVKKQVTPKRIAIIMAIVSLVSFLYKFVLGIITPSALLIVAAVPTFFVFMCKAMYARHMTATRMQKKKGYLIMTIGTFSFALLFFLFSSLKIGGIDITIKNRFEGWIGLIFIFFIIVMFVLSIINLRGALTKGDLIVTGIKEITFESALADGVMIEEFLYRVLLKYLHLPFMEYIDRSFGLIVGIVMLLIPIFMIKRWMKYDTSINPTMEDLGIFKDSNFDIHNEEEIIYIDANIGNVEEIFEQKKKNPEYYFKKEFSKQIDSLFLKIRGEYMVKMQVFFDDLSGFNEEEVLAMFMFNLKILYKMVLTDFKVFKRLKQPNSKSKENL